MGSTEPPRSLLASAVRGAHPKWPAAANAGFKHEVLDSAAMHGVLPLLHRAGLDLSWPAEILKACRNAAVGATAWEMQHRLILAQTLRALQANGCVPLLIKGTALAYTIYQEPGLRQRADTDMVFPPGQKKTADRVLLQLGFERAIATESGQAGYSLRDDLGGSHSIDAHWRINNSTVLSACFDFGELWGRRLQAANLSENAWIPSPEDSLLIACMHRATHAHNPYFVGGEAHHDPDRLIWLMDLDLLTRGFTPDSWADFQDRARLAGLARISLEGLSRARETLGTQIPHAVEAALASAPKEIPAQYLASGWFAQQAMDLRASRNPLSTVREMILPPSGYMRARYAQSRVTWLPYLHARRLIGGIFRRIAASVR